MIREGPSQSQRDRILWTLSNSGGRMEPILSELAREGRIRIDVRDIVSIIY
jgi:hypothetical protein